MTNIQVMKLLSFYGKSTETLDSMEKVTSLYTSLLISSPLQNTDYRSNSKNFPVNTKGYLKGISAPPPIFLGKN